MDQTMIEEKLIFLQTPIYSWSSLFLRNKEKQGEKEIYQSIR